MGHTFSVSDTPPPHSPKTGEWVFPDLSVCKPKEHRCQVSCPLGCCSWSLGEGTPIGSHLHNTMHLLHALTEKIADFSTSGCSFYFLKLQSLYSPLHAPFTWHHPIPTPCGHPALGEGNENSSLSIMLSDPKITGSAKDVTFLCSVVTIS